MPVEGNARPANQTCAACTPVHHCSNAVWHATCDLIACWHAPVRGIVGLWVCVGAHQKLDWMRKMCVQMSSSGWCQNGDNQTKPIVTNFNLSPQRHGEQALAAGTAGYCKACVAPRSAQLEVTGPRGVGRQQSGHGSAQLRAPEYVNRGGPHCRR